MATPPRTVQARSRHLAVVSSRVVSEPHLSRSISAQVPAIDDEPRDVMTWFVCKPRWFVLSQTEGAFIESMSKPVWVRGCLARLGRERYAAAGLLRFTDGELRQVGQIQD